MAEIEAVGAEPKPRETAALKVLSVMPFFAPRYGGSVESTAQLCRHLGCAGCEVKLLASNADGRGRELAKSDELETGPGFEVRYYRRAIGDSVSTELLRLLPRYVKWADVIHLTLAFSFPVIPTLSFARALKKPLLWSPRGAFQRWEGTRRPHMKLVWTRICRAVMPRCAMLHATSREEAEANVAQFPGVPAIIIPNGVAAPDDLLPRNHSADGKLRLLYLGRLDPKKGIENLLEACARLGGQGFDYSLTIAGAGQPGYEQALRRKVEMLALGPKVSLTGELRGAAKEAAFANADVVAMPSYTENYGNVAAEALVRGVPVIVSKGAPWSEVEQVGCGLWVENDPSSLAAAITKMSRMPLDQMGERGRDWMKAQFSWSAVAQQMLAGYRLLLVQADTAAFGRPH